MKAIQGAIDSSNKNITAANEQPPLIQQNNTQINVNVVDTFDRESRERIMRAIQGVLSDAELSNETVIADFNEVDSTNNTNEENQA